MGVLADIGATSGGKLIKGTFAGFVNDVNRRIRTGKSVFNNPTIAKEADSLPYSNISKIEDSSLYPDFYKIWSARYAKMVAQLDVESSFQIVASGAPIIDPTALSAALGSAPPDVKFPDILSEMQGMIPPGSNSPVPPPTIIDAQTIPAVKGIDYFNRYLKNVDPLDPETLPKLMKVLMAPPQPPTAQYPDGRLLKYGYAQQHAFEDALFKSHRLAHASLMAASPAALPAMLASMASGAGCDEVIRMVYTSASKTQPTPMSTSSFEIAAQEVLLQHQARYQCVSVLGQCLGSGAVVKALAATPQSDGGLGVVSASGSSKTISVGPGANNSNASTGDGSGLTNVVGDPVVSGPAPGATSDEFGYSAPPEDLPPPDASASGGPAGKDYGTGTSGTSSYDDVPPPEGQDAGGPSKTSEFGFSEQGNDVPPPAEESSTSANQDAKNNYGSGTGMDDVPPPGDEAGSVQNGYVGPQYETPDDLPPPDVNDSGTQATLPGSAEEPPDVGQEGGGIKQPVVTPKKKDPEVDYSDYAEFNPTPPEEEGPEILPKEGMIDENTIASIPPATNANTLAGGGAGGKGMGANTNPRRRAAEAITQALGNISDNTKAGASGDLDGAPFGGISPMVGIQGTNIDPRWGSNIGGFRGIVGGGFETKEKVDKAAAQNPKATSCGSFAGWLLDNVLFGPGDQSFPFPVDDAAAANSNWPVNILPGNKSYGASKYEFSSRGLTAAGYAAATLGAWVTADPDKYDMSFFKPPRIGDVFLLTHTGTDIVHIGVIVLVNPEKGYCITADAGQGSVSNGSQGMNYVKRTWQTSAKPGGRINVTGEASQGDAGKNRMLFGYIDIDILVKQAAAVYGIKSPFA
jgi:hypothetical protein